MEATSIEAVRPGKGERLPSAPRVAGAHLFTSGSRRMVLSVDDGSIHEVGDALADVLDRAMQYCDADRVDLIMAAAGLGEIGIAPVPPPTSVNMRALSLAVAQACNLGCTYCYAQQGNFGGADRSMSLDVAKAAVDRLLADAPRGEKVSLAFLGGEPLVNRDVLRAVTEYAAGQAAAMGRGIAFALTTNATLLTADDAAFFDRYGFTVTISIDGIGAVHDQLRPFKSGRSSYQRVIERAALLLSRNPRGHRVVARVTVTPKNLRLRETLDELVALGFDGISFSPMLSAPDGRAQMGEGDLDTMLHEMVACGDAFVHHLRAGRRYPFLNLVSMLRRIHEANRDAYPCGAGGGYLGVSAQGKLFACHRFVDDDIAALGDVVDGVDGARQQRWLAERNVHGQEPCRSCWARHLCGGGCHHEVIRRGRPACDYIRGWLHYCLSTYVSLVQDAPPLLADILHASASSTASPASR